MFELHGCKYSTSERAIASLTVNVFSQISGKILSCPLVHWTNQYVQWTTSFTSNRQFILEAADKKQVNFS
ncbi:MAG: hypothetical protein ACRCZS_12780, partial [Chroococcidiopsis sp.]